jgi:hypothetical protein
MLTPRILISVDFPALDALVAYLQSNQQKQIDALAAEVDQLTSRLQTSAAGLASAEQPKP